MNSASNVENKGGSFRKKKAWLKKNQEEKKLNK